MSAEGVRSQFVAAYADVALPDPVEHIVRRGNRIRRARRLRRTAPVVLAAAVLLGVVVLPRFSSTYEPRPIRLVAYEMPRFPLSFRSPPADLDGPRFDLDRVSDPTRRLPTMFYRDRSDPGSQVSVSVRDDKPDLDGDPSARPTSAESTPPSASTGSRATAGHGVVGAPRRPLGDGGGPRAATPTPPRWSRCPATWSTDPRP
jgi:hypothetical protein